MSRTGYCSELHIGIVIYIYNLSTTFLTIMYILFCTFNPNHDCDTWAEQAEWDEAAACQGLEPIRDVPMEHHVVGIAWLAGNYLALLDVCGVAWWRGGICMLSLKYM